MPTRYFDFNGQPARIEMDDADTPLSCALYDPETKDFQIRNDLTLDVYSASNSHLISESEFQALCEKLTKT